MSLAGLSPTGRFVLGTVGTLAFYLLYGYVQEWLFSEPGFSFSLVVTLLQFLTFAGCAALDAVYHRFRPQKSRKGLNIDYKNRFGFLVVLMKVFYLFFFFILLLNLFIYIIYIF